MSLAALNNEPIAVLLGGTSAEREISLQSGANVAAALEALGVSVRKVDPVDSDWLAQLGQVKVAFNAMHGPGGEDGVIQGVLSALGIRYTGSGILGSALAMDKIRSKQLWQGVGIPTGGFVILERNTDWQGVITQFGKVFVKPACEGSSFGMMSADNALDLEAAYRRAQEYGKHVLAEQFLDGPEYSVAILGGQALPSIRLETDNEFYDFEAKYLSDDTRYHCPSDLSTTQEAAIAQLSLNAFHVLGCAVWGRVDVMRDSRGSFYVLEVNTIPGMTSHSLVPMAAAAAGMDMPSLVQSIIELSLGALS